MSKRQLGIGVKNTGNVTIISLDGACDASNVSDFQTALEDACANKGARVLLNCEKLTYVNSTSFGLFFKYHRNCSRDGGAFAMCNVQRKILNIIKILGLDKFLDIYPDKKTALAQLQKPAKP